MQEHQYKDLPAYGFASGLVGEFFDVSNTEPVSINIYSYGY